MTLSRYLCETCRSDTLHGAHGLCIHCNTSAVTHPAAFRDDISLNEGKGVQASRRRGQANLRRYH